MVKSLIFCFLFLLSGSVWLPKNVTLLLCLVFFVLFWKTFMVILFYHLVFKFDILVNVYLVLIPKTLIVGLLAPVFFYMMRRVEVFFYERNSLTC